MFQILASHPVMDRSLPPTKFLATILGMGTKDHELELNGLVYLPL